MSECQSEYLMCQLGREEESPREDPNTDACDCSCPGIKQNQQNMLDLAPRSTGGDPAIIQQMKQAHACMAECQNEMNSCMLSGQLN